MNNDKLILPVAHMLDCLRITQDGMHADRRAGPLKGMAELAYAT